MSDRFASLVPRVRTPMLLVGIAACLLDNLLETSYLSFAGLALILIGFVALFLPSRRAPRDPVAVASPVRGRWYPANSPADRVPSHGTHELGQTYAIDLVHQPDASAGERRVTRWPLVRRPGEFPGFGQPIHAPADGVVVKACGWQRDHWSRDSWPAIIFLFLEGFARSLLSPVGGRFVLGNHVVLDLGDGVYAALVHLKRGSVRVRRGQRVRAGELLGECGNSGNSSEPHLHFQLMDHPSAVIAAGLPFTFPYEIDGERRTGVPGGSQAFQAREYGAGDARAPGAEALEV
jgi:hypothetical protein